MGNYNPHAPIILGQEWVPIRQANFEPDTVTENGYTFRVDHTVTPVTGAYYIAELGPDQVNQACDLIAVYPAGREAITGPIKKVFIPASSIASTGTAINVSAGVAALQNPMDDLTLRFTSPSDNNTFLTVNFDVASYSQQLFGKRILDVKIRMVIKSLTSVELAAIDVSVAYIRDIITDAITYQFEPGLLGSTFDGPSVMSTISLTDLNPFWNQAVHPNLEREIYPWRFQELLQFATSTTAASRLAVVFGNFLPADLFSVFLYFCDLEVTYCEEQRTLYGGRRTTNSNVGTAVFDTYTLGPNLVRLRDVNMAAGATSLAAGEYSVTLEHRDLVVDNAVSPNLHAIRELYQLPNQRGIVINQANEIDEEFAVEDTAILPHLTLHTASAVVTGVHAYGTQNDIPVYGLITATQEIEDDPVPSAAVFPQVRFYARRFGNTTVPLTLVDVATGLSTVSISVADFDALPEIVDGWREVNLRFATAPTFAVAAGDVDWRWSATGEFAGNQWQVLGADGPGTSMHSIGPATYYAPQGDTVALTWQSPVISGTAEDSLSDATLIFSQDPMPVSGFALEIAEQEVDAALECDVLSGCVASAISYVDLTWTAQTFLPVTGFGQYEIERFDAIDAEWKLIMSATSPSVTGFADYEARVGVLTHYRIRTCNILDFCGPWVTGSATIPTPGVTIGGDGNSMLIFTSNRAPTSNLAYTASWEGEPIETYAFPEADEVQLQRMFNRDFRVAFHPLERGGEEFSRSVVVNAAAISLPSLANFRGLRDLAWAQLNYVCVRDELGNRWFANVLVPTGVVRQNRTVYVAQIQVAEVTDTPDPIDPAEVT